MITFPLGEPLVKTGEKIDAPSSNCSGTNTPRFSGSGAFSDRFCRGSAVLLVVFAMFTLCGMYMRYRQRGVQAELDRLAGALGLAVAAVFAAMSASGDSWQAEPVPVGPLRHDHGHCLPRGVGALVRGRRFLDRRVGDGRKSAHVPAVVRHDGRGGAEPGTHPQPQQAVLCRPLCRLRGGLAGPGHEHDRQPASGLGLWRGAGLQFIWATVAGCFMSVLLPFVERLFGVLTDLSLLELGDITHPVLQELVRRAPSTYNHSLTVGSIAKAAADAIGARGLLCRVGAYFHDIGN